MPSRPRGYGGRTGRLVSRRFPVHAAFPASCKPSRGGAYGMLFPVNCGGLVEVDCRRFPIRGPVPTVAPAPDIPAPRALEPRCELRIHAPVRPVTLPSSTSPSPPVMPTPMPNPASLMLRIRFRPPGGVSRTRPAAALRQRHVAPTSGRGPSTPTARACRSPENPTSGAGRHSQRSPEYPRNRRPEPLPPETRINAEGGRATKSRPRAVSAEQVEGSATPAQTGRTETLAGAFHPNTRPLPAGTGRQFRRRDPSYSIHPGTVSRKAAPLSFPPADAGHRSGIAAGHAAHLNRHNARDSSAADLPDVHGPPTHRVR